VYLRALAIGLLPDMSSDSERGKAWIVKEGSARLKKSRFSMYERTSAVCRRMMASKVGCIESMSAATCNNTSVAPQHLHSCVIAIKSKWAVGRAGCEAQTRSGPSPQ
jgi:hypothetical protein